MAACSTRTVAVALTTGDTGKHSRGAARLLVCCPVLHETVSLHLHRKGLVFKAPECGLKIDLLLAAVPPLCRLLWCVSCAAF